MAASGWKEDLSQYGNYYEGWVNDIDDCLTSHAKAIVTVMVHADLRKHQAVQHKTILQQMMKISLHKK